MAVGTLARVLTHPLQLEIKKDFLSKSFVFNNGGEGGIRTRERFHTLLDFQSSAFSRTQPPLHIYLIMDTIQYGGESEIRTHEAGFSRLLDFESSAFDQLGHLSSNL